MTWDDAKLQRVASHCRSGQCGEAISVLEDLVRGQPANPELHYQLGMCYSGACKSHAFVAIAVAVAYFEHARDLIGSAGSPVLEARYLDSLGNAYLWDHRTDAAIVVLKRAAELYATLGLKDDWAREQYNLGNTFCDVSASEVPNKWLLAIEHYEHALTVRTKEHDAPRYASTIQNLGTAFRELCNGDRTSNVRAAIGCYREAMRIYTDKSYPAEHAALHNNLGNAYMCLPGSIVDTRKNIRRAMLHFEHALKTGKRSGSPCECAAAQFNLGIAYVRRAELGDGNGWTDAVYHLRQAEESFRVCHDSGHAAAAHAELLKIENRIKQDWT